MSSPKKRRMTKALLARQIVNYSERFEAFWRAYPRNENKRVAWQAWNDLGGEDIDGGIATQIHTAAVAFAKEVEKEGRARQYIPLPSTWLNQARWEDYEHSESEKQKPNCFYYGGHKLSTEPD